MPPEIFIGRQEELEKIESPSGVNIVYGGRQLGKSALLKKAKMDIDFDENKMTVRHEVGHCYGLYHCARGTNCVMAEAAPIGTYNSICSKHNSAWNSVKTKY